MSNFQEKFIKSRVKLLKKSPFFGTILLHTEYKFCEEIPTAATDGSVLLINEEWMCKQTEDNFNGVLLHEVLHMALEHINRTKDLEDMMICNIAADIVVNGIIKDNHISLPEEAIYDDDLKHLGVREIYSILKEKQNKDKNYIKNKYGKNEVNNCLQASDEQTNSGKPSENDKPENKSKWRNIIQKAKTISKIKDAGVKGSGLERIFKDFLEPTINWRDVLYRYITQSRADFEGYDRRFIHNNTYIDDVGGDKVNIAAFVDTSGSVDETLLTEFISELSFAIQSIKGVTGYLYYFDTELYPQGTIEDLSGIPKPVGLGGTSFVPVMKEIDTISKENSTHPTLGIIYTDGWAPMTWKEPDAPVLWCISPGGVDESSIKYGDVVRIMH
jgi:predicted metal-dependent peptidase